MTPPSKRRTAAAGGRDRAKVRAAGGFSRVRRPGRVVLFQTAAPADVGCSVTMSGLKQPSNIPIDFSICL